MTYLLNSAPFDWLLGGQRSVSSIMTLIYCDMYNGIVIITAKSSNCEQKMHYNILIRIPFIVALLIICDN